MTDTTLQYQKARKKKPGGRVKCLKRGRIG